MDILTPEQRHINMSHIRGTDTYPEVIVRKYLFGRGLRYLKNYRKLPGRPDIVFPKYKTAIFINGCFWHGHEGCRYSCLPKSNTSFWRIKIEQNMKRDQEVVEKLQANGWKIITVWECEIKKSATREQRLQDIYEEITKQSQ